MSSLKKKPEFDPNVARKARMLITILGNDFTRRSSHPFFKSLTEAAAKPVSQDGKPADLSKALKTLMTQIAKSNQKATQPHAPKLRKQTIPNEQYFSPEQHPALIASAASKLDAVKRREVLKTLDGKLAYKVLLYIREIEELATQKNTQSTTNST